MVFFLKKESLRNEKKRKRYRKIRDSPHATHAYMYTHAQSYVCTSSYAIAASIDIRARDCRESQEETNEKRTAGLGSYVRHVWVLDYIYIPIPPRAR